jgi:hypothetical protein
MVVLTEKKPQRAALAIRIPEELVKECHKLYFKETSNLPAIAKGVRALSNNKYISMNRQDTIFSTLQGYGLNPYINKMNNIVCPVPSMEDGAMLMQDIFNKWGVRPSVVITYEGQTKIYIDPKVKPDMKVALAYANAVGLPPPNPHKYLA